jgi:hypothetical protein
MPDQEPAETRREAEGPGTSRRGMLRGAAGIGAAGLAAGVLAGAVAAPAGAAVKDDDRSAAHREPLIAYVHDANTGVIDLYTGEEHIRFTDRRLAARFAQAAS